MAQIVVTHESFQRDVDLLAMEPKTACDTEATGLHPYQGDRLFSIIVADRCNEYYFNFNPAEDFESDEVLPREWIRKLQPLFLDGRRVFMANAKFDMHMLAQEGLEFWCDIWCVQAAARVEYNQRLKISLDTLLKEIGSAKDDAVKEYIDAHKLYEWYIPPGKKKRAKRMFFAKVPRAVIVPYGCSDARGTFVLGEHQERRFDALDAAHVGAPSSWLVANNERRLTRTVFKLEREGLRLDLEYCKRALSYERTRADQAAAEFISLTGVDEFVDSAKALGPILTPLGVTPGVTDGGAPSYDWDALVRYQDDIPAVKALLTHRDAAKRAETYYSNYLKFVTPQGRIHTTLKPDRPITGRFASEDPNLQNLPDPEEDTGPFPVRRAFIPDPWMFLSDIDYKTMEYRLMLDYAQEKRVIEQVLSGVDLHQAIADLLGVKRAQAKTINFALLYGQGDEALAASLRVTKREARDFRLEYFARLPGVERFVRSVKQTAERRGYIFNWMGRRYWVPDPRWGYKAPNALIQGGCADIIKKAMNDVDDLLERKRARTRINLNVHDELLLNTHPSEIELIPEIMDLMRKAYKPRSLPMDCSVYHSFKSWGDLVDGLPEKVIA